MMDNICLILDVSEVSSSLDVNTGLISLDQEKTLNTTSSGRSRGGLGFLTLIKVSYSDIGSVMIFNGGLCAPFRAHKDIQQGCALSGMLYSLSLEALLQRLHTNIEGLILPGFNENLVYLLMLMSALSL